MSPEPVLSARSVWSRIDDLAALAQGLRPELGAVLAHQVDPGAVPKRLDDLVALVVSIRRDLRSLDRRWPY